MAKIGVLIAIQAIATMFSKCIEQTNSITAASGDSNAK